MICAKERKDLIKFRNAEFEEHRQTTHSNVHSGLKSGEGKIVEERWWPTIQGDMNTREKKKMKKWGAVA